MNTLIQVIPTHPLVSPISAECWSCCGIDLLFPVAGDCTSTDIALVLSPCHHGNEETFNRPRTGGYKSITHSLGLSLSVIASAHDKHGVLACLALIAVAVINSGIMISNIMLPFLFCMFPHWTWNYCGMCWIKQYTFPLIQLLTSTCIDDFVEHCCFKLLLFWGATTIPTLSSE